MSKTSTVVNAELRNSVFSMLDLSTFRKINDRQYGIIMPGSDGEQHYVRIGAIVAEQREDMTAEELMQSEIDAYEAAQAKKAEKAAKAAAKAAEDARKRAEKAEQAEKEAWGEEE